MHLIRNTKRIKLRRFEVILTPLSRFSFFFYLSLFFFCPTDRPTFTRGRSMGNETFYWDQWPKRTFTQRADIMRQVLKKKNSLYDEMKWKDRPWTGKKRSGLSKPNKGNHFYCFKLGVMLVFRCKLDVRWQFLWSRMPQRGFVCFEYDFE